MEQSLARDPPRTCSLSSPGLSGATPGSGTWKRKRNRLSRGSGQRSWGERPLPEKAREERAGGSRGSRGSRGWGCASGRRGPPLPEVSAGQSERRGWGARLEDRGGPTLTAPAPQVEPRISLSLRAPSPAGWGSGGGPRRGPWLPTPSLRPGVILQVAVTGPFPCYSPGSLHSFPKPSPIAADQSTPTSLPPGSLFPVFSTSFQSEIAPGWAPIVGREFLGRGVWWRESQWGGLGEGTFSPCGSGTGAEVR